MIKQILSFSFFFILSLGWTQSLPYVSKKEAQVEIITQTGEKLKGKTRYNNLSELQEELVFFSKQNEMQVFKPFEIKGFTMENKVFVSIEQIGILSGIDKLFLHLLVDGNLKLYEVYQVNHETEEKHQYYLQKGQERLYSLNDLKFLNFRKGMSQYLAPAPEVASRVADKTYTVDDILTIVEEYNGSFELSKLNLGQAPNK
jgi:hypothetical protein